MGVLVVGVGLTMGAVSALVTGGLAIRWGLRLGFIDRPDEHLKTHTGTPVPLGGVAVMFGVHAGMAVAGSFDIGLFAATLVLFVVGLVDDDRGLSPIVRLAASAGAGLVLAVSSDQVTGVLAGAAVVCLVVVTVNAVNLLDGLDALAGSVSAVAFVGLATLGMVQGMATPWVILIVSSALIGFLYWNTPPARLYLGDNGAYVVGGLLAWAVVQVGSDWPSSLVGAALIGVPFLDLGVTVARRLRYGKPLFSGDRDHTYDRLIDRGLAKGAVVLVFIMAQVVWMVFVLGTASQFGDIAASATAVSLGMLVVVVATAVAPRSLSPE